MTRRIAIIDAHPDPAGGHLCNALADAYAAGAAEAGHEVRQFAIAGFDIPFLRTEREFELGVPPDDILGAQETISWAQHVVIVFPLWLGTMPAILKAFLEQTLRPHFAHEPAEGGFPKKLLRGRSVRIVITMGMPPVVYRWIFGAHGLRNLKRGILAVCGFKPVRDTLLGPVGAADEDRRKRWLDEMTALGRRGE